MLLRSWIAGAGLVDSAACVQVQRQERDPQRFWIAVIDALRDTIAGSKLVRPLTAAPDLNGCAVVERPVEDLDPLEDRLWLVIDDLDELRSAGALRQLQLPVQRASPELRLVLAARHDLWLGLHRLWLWGQLTELRADDLRFNLDEARALSCHTWCATVASTAAASCFVVADDHDRGGRPHASGHLPR